MTETFLGITPADIESGNLPPGCVSPRIGDSHGIPAPSDKLREQQLEEAWAVRASCAAGEWPSWWLEKQGLPSRDPAHGYDQNTGEMLADAIPDLIRRAMEDGAGGPNHRHSHAWAAGNLVRMDRPTTLAADLIDYVWRKVESDHNLFVERQAVLGECAAEVARTLQICFDTKWNYLIERPFETLENRTGAPKQQLQQYAHPLHPEFPAGHGTFAGAIARVVEGWIDNLVFGGVLAQEHADHCIELVHQSTQLVAAFRTFSGMHVAYSNNAGWLLGYAGPGAAADYMDALNAEAEG